jgi:hypothetical protein
MSREGSVSKSGGGAGRGAFSFCVLLDVLGEVIWLSGDETYVGGRGRGPDGLAQGVLDGLDTAELIRM